MIPWLLYAMPLVTWCDTKTTPDGTQSVYVYCVDGVPTFEITFANGPVHPEPTVTPE